MKNVKPLGIRCVPFTKPEFGDSETYIAAPPAGWRFQPIYHGFQLACEHTCCTVTAVCALNMDTGRITWHIINELNGVSSALDKAFQLSPIPEDRPDLVEVGYLLALRLRECPGGSDLSRGETREFLIKLRDEVEAEQDELEPPPDEVDPNLSLEFHRHVQMGGLIDQLEEFIDALENGTDEAVGKIVSLVNLGRRLQQGADLRKE